MPDINNARLLLKRYRAGAVSLTDRIVENEQWYNMRHLQSVSTDKYLPASAWLFNSLAVKHADAMEAMPVPYVTAREPGDTESAEALSKILPVILERNDFRSVYSAIWNDKLKHGTGCYGVFWNPEANGMLGEIEIKRIDVLNLFFEPGCTELDASPNLFHCELKSIDEVMALYPWIKELSADPAEESLRYLYDDKVDVSDKVSVIDWYYKKKRENGTVAVHYCKLAGNNMLYCTENDPLYKDRGLYDHGRYPFVTDVMYPIKGTPCGFGALDIMKDAQMQIDKLNCAILENARMAATRRYFIRADGSVNEQEFADFTRPFVHIQGAGLGEDSIREISTQPLSDIYLSVINNKITELKETSGNRDVNSGGLEKGVVAASAISALQQSGEKMTRDMIAGSYRAFCKVCSLIVELIRQFYTAPRCFRIVGGSYMTYDSSAISAICGDGEAALPCFDIIISAESGERSRREAINAIAKELYSMGVFDPDKRSSARILISMMEFEGKERLLAALDENDNS